MLFFFIFHHALAVSSYHDKQYVGLLYDKEYIRFHKNIEFKHVLS